LLMLRLSDRRRATSFHSGGYSRTASRKRPAVAPEKERRRRKAARR
jgi:hypothetical protein